jgi:hypothetical protein
VLEEPPSQLLKIPEEALVTVLKQYRKNGHNAQSS